jgi:hypothetical protein
VVANYFPVLMRNWKTLELVESGDERQLLRGGIGIARATKGEVTCDLLPPFYFDYGLNRGVPSISRLLFPTTRQPAPAEGRKTL